MPGVLSGNANASYVVEDGAIVGTSAPNTQNTFLCTEKTYGDFILEYEMKVDARLNRGVQIRSEVFDEQRVVDLGNGKARKVPAGRVHGYQVESDPNKPDRMWTAGIYDEARRGWLYPGAKGGDAAKFTAQEQSLFRKDDWNRFRVEAVGDSIKTYLNGELRSDFKDDMTLKGFIALQVHGVRSVEEPLPVMWRNIRIKEMAP